MELELLKSLLAQAPGIAAVVLVVVIFLRSNKEFLDTLKHIQVEHQIEYNRLFNRFEAREERITEALDKCSNTLGHAMYALKNGKDS